MAQTIADSLRLELPNGSCAKAICERVADLGAADDDCAILFELHTADGRLCGQRHGRCSRGRLRPLTHRREDVQ